MLGYIAHGIANPIARLWLATSSQSWRRLPTPSGATAAHADGSDSDRVLLLGSGVAVGYGVMSHDLALAGNLARELSDITGRGTTVNVIASPDISPSSARHYADGANLARFDGLVLTLGGLEVFTLMPARVWRRQLDALIAHLHETAPASLSIFVVETGVPLLRGVPRFFRRAVAKHAAVLNNESRAIAGAHPNTTFVAFDPKQGDLAILTGRSTYREWAALLAPVMADVLDEEARAKHPLTVDERVRQNAVDALAIDHEPNAEIDAIVANARDLFGTAGASVTIIDHDVQHTKSAVGMPDSPMPRSVAICDQTIRRAAVFVVEDAMTDPRLAGTMWADGERLRFYAGYPVESPDGQHIGALCVVDTVPRTFSDSDAALLRQLALRVQSALWRDRVAR